MKTRVLFLCTGNAARSQIAEGLVRHNRGDLFEVASAGTKPRGVHPLAVDVMAEQGIDISKQKNTPVHHFEGQAFDYVITLCDRAREACTNAYPLGDR